MQTACVVQEEKAEGADQALHGEGDFGVAGEGWRGRAEVGSCTQPTSRRPARRDAAQRARRHGDSKTQPVVSTELAGRCCSAADSAEGAYRECKDQRKEEGTIGRGFYDQRDENENEVRGPRALLNGWGFVMAV